jgi:hypothetical protein
MVVVVVGEGGKGERKAVESSFRFRLFRLRQRGSCIQR